MKKEIKPMDSSLRQKAEELLKQKMAIPNSLLSETDILKLVHELEVHQIELEMQNEELRIAKVREAVLATEKYIELYDFAPSGYFTLSKAGKIIDLNLSGALMLGKERMYLENNWFDDFVASDTKSDFYSFLDKLFTSKSKEACDLSLSANDQVNTYVHLAGIAAENGEQCFVTAVDITERKQVEEFLSEREKLYRSLFENMLNGFAYCQMHFDENNHPVNFVYLAVNESFSVLTGLKDVIGRNVTEVIPGISETDPELLEIYGRVARNGKPERFEFFVSSLQLWLSISVYSPAYSFFVTVFDVITERKKEEEEILKSMEIQQQFQKHLTEIRENERAVISREIHDQVG